MSLWVTVYKHPDGKLAGRYDIRVNDTDNGRLLMSSHQGYENRAEAEWIAVRCFGDAQTIAKLKVKPEPDVVVLATDLGDGDEKVRVIR